MGYKSTEKEREYARAYYHEHKEKQAANAKSWAKRNRDYLRQYEVNRRLSTPINKVLWKAAKDRAKRLGIPFNIDVEDITVPDVCPVMGCPLELHAGVAKFNSPALDRIIPELGYIKGNVQVLSHKANVLKSNATFEQIEKLYLLMKGLQND